MVIIKEYLTPLFESPDLIPTDLKYTKNGDPVFDENDNFNLKAEYTDQDAYPFWLENGELILGDAGKEHPKGIRDIPHAYAGRLWTDWKIISFWHYPPVNMFKHILNELSELLEERFNEPFDIYNDERWEVEIVPENSWISNNEYESKLINPKLYTGIGYYRTDDELNKEHVKSPLLKQKKYLKGWGSSSSRYRANRIWQMAAPIGENLNSFVRNLNPVKSLGLGYEATIRTFFRNLNVSDEKYKIKKDGEIIFERSLYLDGASINQLPNNLTIRGNLDLSNTQISELPNNLTVTGNLWINNTLINEIPDDLIVDKGEIGVDYTQQNLINFIKSSKFKNKLCIL